MHIFRNRPLALACCLFALTAVFSLCERTARVRWVLLAVLLLSVCFLLLSAFLRRTGGHWERLWLCLLAMLLAVLSSHLYFDVHCGRVSRALRREARVVATVLSREESAAYYSEYRIRITEIDGENILVKAHLSCAYAGSLQPGDRFSLSVDPLMTSFSMDTANRYDLADGFLLTVESDEPEDILCEEGKSRDPAVFFSTLNHRLASLLQERVKGEEGALAASLVLGAREKLSDLTVLQFRRAGISHILALSGLHVSILLGAVELLLRRCRVPKRVRAVALPLVALAYLLLVGATPSASRAVLLVCMTYLGFMLGESYDPFTALSAALVLMLLLTPYAVLDLSMWMSFLAAGAIIIFLPALRDRWQIRGRLRRPSVPVRVWRAFLTAAWVGISANLALLLLTALVYGEISLLSVPATLLLSVPTEMFLVLSALSLLFPGVWLHRATAGVGGLLLRMAGAISALPGIVVSAKHPLLMGGLFLATVLLCLFAVISLPKKRLLLLPVAVATLSLLLPPILSALPRENAVEATYVNTAHGQTLLLVRGTEAVAIDFSDGARENANALVTALREHGGTELSALLLPTCENRDTGFVATVASQVLVRTLYLPEDLPPQEAAIAARVAEEAKTMRVAVSAWSEGTLLLPWVEMKGRYVERSTEGRAEGVLVSFACEGVLFSAVDGRLDERRLPSWLSVWRADSEVIVVGASWQGKDAVGEAGLPSVRLAFYAVASSDAGKWLPADAVVWTGERKSFLLPVALEDPS